MDQHDRTRSHWLQTSLRGGQTSLQDITVNITKEFAAAARGLANGRVASARDFRLFDAIGAIEIGDPKMDSGLLLPAESEEPMYDVGRELSLREVVHVTDVHLFYFMDWNMGMPLAQTVLASHYVDFLLKDYNKSDALLDQQYQPWLRYPSHSQEWKVGFGQYFVKIMAIAITRMCGVIIDTIRHSDSPFYEDEDISLQTMGRDLFPLVTLAVLQDRIAELQHFSKLVMDEYRLSGADVDHMAMHAIHARTKLLALLAGVIENVTIANTLDVQSAMQQLESIRLLEGSVPGIEVPNVFSSLIQHRGGSNSPLRPLTEYCFDKTYDMVQNLICSLQYETEASRAVLMAGSRFVTKRYLSNFACRRKFCLPYTRAAVYGHIWSNANMDWLAELIVDMAQTLPIEVFQRASSEDGLFLSGSEQQIFREFGHDYVQLVHIPYYRAICSNASRMRRLLCHCLHGMNKMQQRVIALDRAIVSMALSVLMRPAWLWWAISKCDLLLQITELGFQQEIYAEDEFVAMYGCLADFGRERATYIKDAISECKFRREQTDHDEAVLGSLTRMLVADEAEMTMRHAVHMMHVLVRELDPRPSGLSPQQEQKRWDVRTRHLWQAGFAVMPWKELQCKVRVLDKNVLHREQEIQTKLGQLRSLFRQARDAYRASLAAAVTNENVFLKRVDEDCCYHEKTELAEKAMQELDAIMDAVRKGAPLRMRISKVTMTSDRGARLVYQIPGLHTGETSTQI